MINVPRGGARNRSGPQPDENSLKSAKIGYTLNALPSEGYQGEPPAFPLPRLNIWKAGERDETATRARRTRELALWKWAWSTPQACAWSQEPWRWHSVAMWVRTFALCESSDASAADKGSLHRFADQIGLTPAGLKENGWKIARDEVAEKRFNPGGVIQPAPRSSARDRLQALAGGGGA